MRPNNQRSWLNKHTRVLMTLDVEKAAGNRSDVRHHSSVAGCLLWVKKSEPSIVAFSPEGASGRDRLCPQAEVDYHCLTPRIPSSDLPVSNKIREKHPLEFQC